MIFGAALSADVQISSQLYVNATLSKWILQEILTKVMKWKTSQNYTNTEKRSTSIPHPPFLQPALPKRRNYKPGRFKLPFQKNVLIFHCEPLWRENTKLQDCLLAAKCNSAIKLCLRETCPYVHTYTRLLTSRPFTEHRLW